jgi:hypothetical protein
VWVSDLDGLWQSATNWSPGVPVAGDHVVIDRTSCEAFVTRGGRIPAPIHSFKN